MGLFCVPAVLFIQGIQCVKEGHALSVIPRGHLRQQHGGSDGVLIPDVITQHIAIGFLIGEDDLTLAGLLQGVLFFRHELEAGEGIEALYAVALRHLPGHFRGDDGFEGHGVGGHLPGALHGADQIIQQQHAGLVAGDGLELALMVPHHDADPVAVRVGA